MSFPLAYTTELLLGTWTDITSDTYQRDPVTITRGRSDEASKVDPSSCDLTLDNRSGNYSPRNPTGTHFGVLTRNTPLRVLTPSALDPYMALPGREESYASTPDAASLDITGDLDLRMELEPLTWRPSGNYGLARKYETTSDERSWLFAVTSTGQLQLYWSPNGTLASRLSASSTVAIPAASTRLALRVTLDVNNGAAGNDVRFYTSTAIDGTWTQLGATVTTAGVTSVHAGTAALEVGRSTAPSPLAGVDYEPVQGDVYALELRSGIGGAGTVVASPDFTAQDSGDVEFDDAQALTWTLQGNATMVNPNARFHGEVPAWQPRSDESGSDVYTPVQAAGVMRRLGQGAAALKSTMYRGLTALDRVVAYWPCEDSEGATELASGLPGQPPMLHPSGTLDNASFTDFKASAALPTGSGLQWSGLVSDYAITGETQVNFLLAVPSGGVASTSQICRIRASGSAQSWTLHVNTAGSLRLQAFNVTDVQIADSGFIAFAVNGKLLRVSIELDHTGADVDWAVATLEVGQTSGMATSGTLVTRTIGRIRSVSMNVGGVLTDTALGHISVENEITSIYDLSDELNAYSGESATDRILRLCREEGMPVTIVGDVNDATELGAQLPETLLDLLREAAEADLGILHEPRGHLGLAYRTRASLYAQDAALALDYASADLSAFEPVEDDKATRNDITVKRAGGSSARVELTTGALSVNAPPAGVGRYDEEVTISVERDEDLRDQAGWRLHLGTVDEARYPVIAMNLARAAFTGDAALTTSAETLDIGGKITVENLPAWMPPDDVAQIAQGFTEVLTRFDWQIEVNCSPGSPWDVALWNESSGAGEARYSSDGSALVAGAALLLNGVSPGRAATPDAAALDIVGDIDLRVHVAMDDWTPAAAQALITKSTTSGNQVSWRFNVLTTGVLRFVWSVDGSATLTADSTAAPTVANAAPLWVRATIDVDNGAAGRSVRFYTSPDGETWTQLGATVTTAGVTSIFSSTAPVIVGSREVGTLDRLAGRVFSAQIRSGIAGTIVANPNFGLQLAGATSFADSTVKTWTITSPAVLDGARIVVDTPTGPLWGDDDQPYDIYVAGERMTVTAVAGTSSPQLFTVTRSVNGVVKALVAGDEVRLFKPAIYAL